ncbi:Floral homeotic protein [Asimina triloba]
MDACCMTDDDGVQGNSIETDGLLATYYLVHIGNSKGMRGVASSSLVPPPPPPPPPPPSSHFWHSFPPPFLSFISFLFLSHFIICNSLERGEKEREKRRKMGRGKIEIKKIENATNRQVTYSKRRAGITKKAKELTVLCDAEVCLIMFSGTGKFSEYCSPSTTTKKTFDRYQQVSGINLWESHYERIGEDLDDLELEQLRGLEQNIESSVKAVRERKEGLADNSGYGLVDDGADYEAVLALANGTHNLHDAGFGIHDLRLA